MASRRPATSPSVHRPASRARIIATRRRRRCEQALSTRLGPLVNTAFLSAILFSSCCLVELHCESGSNQPRQRLPRSMPEPCDTGAPENKDLSLSLLLLFDLHCESCSKRRICFRKLDPCCSGPTPNTWASVCPRSAKVCRVPRSTPGRTAAPIRKTGTYSRE